MLVVRLDMENRLAAGLVRGSNDEIMLFLGPSAGVSSILTKENEHEFSGCFHRVSVNLRLTCYTWLLLYCQKIWLITN